MDARAVDEANPREELMRADHLSAPAPDASASPQERPSSKVLGGKDERGVPGNQHPPGRDGRRVTITTEESTAITTEALNALAAASPSSPRSHAESMFSNTSLSTLNRSNSDMSDTPTGSNNGIMSRSSTQTWQPSLLQAPVLRVKETRVSTFTEYFFDILYVMPLQNLFFVPFGSLDFCVFFFATFNSWLGEAFYHSRFDTDDLVSRSFQVLSMLSVAGMSFGIMTDSVTEGGATFMLCYAFCRFLLVLRYVRVWLSPSGGRCMTKWFVSSFGFAVLLWTCAALTKGPARPVLAIAGLVVDYATPFIAIPWILHVNRSHMTDRFAGITTLVSAGSLFALLMGPMPPIIYFGGRGEEPLLFPAEQIGVWLLGMLTPITMLLLYSQVIGMENKGFATSRTVRYRVYCYMYLHTVLAFSIEGAACAISSIDCSGDFCSLAEGRLVQMLGCFGAVHLVIGLLHILGDHGGNDQKHLSWRRRAAVRIFCGILLIVTAVALTGRTQSLGVLGCYGLVSALGVVQVLLDYLPVMNVAALQARLLGRESRRSSRSSRGRARTVSFQDDNGSANGASLQPIPTAERAAEGATEGGS